MTSGEESTKQTQQCPKCETEHNDWELVGEQTIPTNFGYGRAVEHKCGRCDGTVVYHQ